MFDFRQVFDLRKAIRFWVLAAVVSVSSPVFAAEPYQGRIFDAHVHYWQNAWDAVDAEAALRLLDEAGVTGALTSSTPDEGTLRLVREEHPRVRIVPLSRPYEVYADRTTWFKRPDKLKLAEEALETGEYMGFGEVHIHSPVNLANPRLLSLIRRLTDKGLFFHAHARHDVITRIFKMSPNVKIIWAHAGFDMPDVVGRMMDTHENLWADLSLREFGTLDDEGIADAEGINPEWKSLFLRHPDRFMIGSDTWNIQRWLGLKGIIDANRIWLGALPKDVADQIAHQNGERLFGRSK